VSFTSRQFRWAVEQIAHHPCRRQGCQLNLSERLPDYQCPLLQKELQECFPPLLVRELVMQMLLELLHQEAHWTGLLELEPFVLLVLRTEGNAPLLEEREAEPLSGVVGSTVQQALLQQSLTISLILLPLQPPPCYTVRWELATCDFLEAGDLAQLVFPAVVYCSQILTVRKVPAET
jgi:hypothetical protein